MNEDLKFSYLDIYQLASEVEEAEKTISKDQFICLLSEAGEVYLSWE